MLWVYTKNCAYDGPYHDKIGPYYRFFSDMTLLMPLITCSSHKRIMVVLLVFATLVFEVSINIFLPILPILQDHYHTSAAMVQYSITAYLLGFGFLGLVAGPLSDHIGRRPMVLLGITLFWLGSALCYWYATRSLTFFIASRFLQGLGAGIATVLVVAIVRDLFNFVRAAQVLSIIGVLVAIAPMAAPLFGGLFAEFGQWTHIFLVILILSKLLLLCFVMLGKESLSYKKVYKLKTLFRESRLLLKNHECMGYLSISALIYGILFAWITQAPFFFKAVFGLDDLNYALYASLGPLFYTLGSLCNFFMLKHYKILSLLTAGLSLCGVMCLVMVFTALSANPSIWSVLTPFLVFNMGLSFVFSNTATIAIDLGGDKKGTTSAFLASFEQFGAAFATLCVGFFKHDSMLPTSIFMLVGCVLTLVIFIKVSSLSNAKVHTFL